MATSSAASQKQSQAPAGVKEYTIKVPKNVQKRYHVMRFNGNLEVDFAKWTQVKMERENNLKEYKSVEEEQPKFGAGSEFGREAKEEARRKKLGIVARKYRPEDQPWILKSYGSTVKKFKGIREGGVSENTAYYVFTHAADGAIEAFPLHEWYKFQPIQRYKALTAEEAEQEFNKRNKHLNYFSLMLRKRLKGEDDTELDEGEEKGKKNAKKSKELKISDMDEWMDSSDDEGSEEEEKEEEEEKKEKKKKKGKKVDPKKKKRDTDVEAFEDSDDGDGEGRELDYISDSSESEPENTNLESVAEEKALRKLLTSDEDSENDSDKSEKEQSNEDEENKEKESEKTEEGADKDKKKKNKKKNKKEIKKEVKKEKESNSDFSSDSSTDEETKKKKNDKKMKKEEREANSANSSRSATPTDHKRKLVNDVMAGPSAKKQKLDLPNYIVGSSESGITEDAVRKYLMRKPMTTTELLQKFKSKKTGLSSEQLVNIMTQILKKINPVKQTLKGKMYLSIKS
ncbi:general transcription factor IIF subunit 1 isoform X1 [Tribolium castaneum]|uniref:Transcription initiation factor IIF subunit alpha n=1 Tax=Tribolium castaneum TaxID=7070 RepID=A0A139WB64_TRICA|nr:PREDICTED: general transcription factor IIF subunit 1 isoform X1 [Tribolium castaneum]KYB25152.1 General transcription factor IIF subunit 1-like Protein [Tribolium castaneum]|eukprot:XP_008198571.1 PREDICTED: general transcription factor IIF subunit 1 isoform X1 [Tribolium castaneum]